MEYICLAEKNGAFVRAYLARIDGEDSKWVFKRKFLDMNITNLGTSIMFDWELGGHGVFELSVKWIDREKREELHRERNWFVYYRRKIYDIDRSEVLFVLFNLKKQYVYI